MLGYIWIMKRENKKYSPPLRDRVSRNSPLIGGDLEGVGGGFHKVEDGGFLFTIQQKIHNHFGSGLFVSIQHRC